MIICPECEHELRPVDIVIEDDGTPTCIVCGCEFEYAEVYNA